MADLGQRFFCHQCNVEIPRIAADFTCPTCNSGKTPGFVVTLKLFSLSLSQALLRSWLLARVQEAEQEEEQGDLARMMTAMVMSSTTWARSSDLWSPSCRAY